MENTIKILKYARFMEEEGKRFYEGAAARANTKKAREIFKELAIMEAEHSEFLRKQIKALEDGNNWGPVDHKIKDKEAIFKDAVEKHGNKDELEGSLADMATLRMAYLIENDFALFYKDASEKEQTPEGKAIFEMLAKWEEGHRSTLLEEYQKLMKENWFTMGYEPF